MPTPSQAEPGCCQLTPGQRLRGGQRVTGQTRGAPMSTWTSSRGQDHLLRGRPRAPGQRGWWPRAPKAPRTLQQAVGWGGAGSWPIWGRATGQAGWSVQAAPGRLWWAESTGLARASLSTVGINVWHPNAPSAHSSGRCAAERMPSPAASTQLLPGGQASLLPRGLQQGCAVV